jgi:hypothetical protein
MTKKQTSAAEPATTGVRHDAFQVQDGEDGQKSYWTRIGVAFPDRWEDRPPAS